MTGLRSSWPLSGHRTCVAVGVLLLAGCLDIPGGGSPTSWLEVARAPSPDGRLDAVLIEQNGGATTG